MRGNRVAGELPQLPIPRRPERASQLPTSLPGSAKAVVRVNSFPQDMPCSEAGWLMKAGSLGARKLLRGTVVRLGDGQTWIQIWVPATQTHVHECS